jgi:formylglycine-generating enzyme required for sulfatase activity
MKHPRITPKSITSLVLLLCALLWAVPAAWAVRVVATTPEGKEIHLYNNSYALVLGNGNYSNGWDPLPGALRDVDDVAKALKKNGFKVTLKKNLTRESFNRAFGRFCHKYGRDENNRLLFYYAGHGHTQKMATNEDLGYLVMVDAPSPQSDPVGFEMASVDMQTMVTRAKKIKSRHVLFMFDSCFSGSILNLREHVVPENISDSVKLPVRQFITAGRANEPVPDHSIFKVAFLDLLEGRGREPNPDGYITGEELGFYLKNTVPKYNAAQHPQYGKIRDIRLDKGDFVFQLASSGAQVVTPDPSGTTLSVSANVDGAAVLVDGKKVGETPLSDAAVSPGQHRISIEKEGYEPYQKRVRIDRGRAVSLFVDLSEAGPVMARLYVEVTPEDARVRILNIGPKFYQGMDLGPGRYHVEVSKEGYEADRRWVMLSAGEDENISVRLEPVKVAAPAPVQVRPPVSRQPKGALTNNLGMKFVYIKPGSFMMGSPSSESGRDNDETQHRVTLTEGFYLQTTEVTQGQWERVMGSNPSHFKNCGSDCPVEKVSWNDVQTFIQKLNQMEGTGKYRLPTEAEWEYACRAGSMTAIYTGSLVILGKNNGPALDPIAWYGGNSCVNYGGGYDCSGWDDKQYQCSKCGTQQVGRKKPNSWGLYDMHGNVWEWCQDWYGDYPSGSMTDPEGPSSGAYRVNRGGSWSDVARGCRSAIRFWYEPGYRRSLLGFRLARAQ